ncbi:site-specific DNA-methyltransferase [Oribacterium sp. C9]|uniref:site-specific DNA-methyltransferase n=1 Tax=Oribacterium sp. C9 TaxID=1943579 RepID=UPI00098F912F|nr:site-specific DNA-methyltransferase [Oribacterium sp. C9]OON85761.1 site-specific DNA-methyltransferase [Oribacterium sp. C9]
MEKMRMESMDMTVQNIEKIETLFPNCITEFKDSEGNIKKAINFDILRQMLSNEIVEGPEAYEFTWVGKKSAIVEANKPIRKTLRPCKEGSVNWDETKNLYIQGDNLEVLKLLQESYLGMVNMIYIDPPYNTGSNLIYKNNFFQTEAEFLEDEGVFDDDGNRLVVNSRTNGRFHSDWCTMIYARLLLARNLLASDGIIALTIDDSEIENVTAIMNEVFGEENHLATIIIKNNPSGRSTVTGASISHEYALFYGANTNVKLGRLPRNDKQIARYKEKDEIGQFEWVNFRKHGGYKEDAPSMYYPIYINKENMTFRIPKLEWNGDTKEYTVLEKPTIEEIVSYPIDENGRPRRWKWSLERAISDTSDMCVRLDRDKNPAVYIKARMKDEGMLPLTVWDEKQYSSTEYGTNMLTNLLGKRYFDYPKSIYAVMDCLRIGHSEPNGIFLDFFSGSATTAEAVMRLNAEDGGNRHFIMVQLPEKTDENSEAYKDGYKTICDIGKERIRRAGKKIIEESSLNHNELDIGFRNFIISDSNMNEVYYSADRYSQGMLAAMESNIKSDRTDLDLLFGCVLEWGLPLSLPYSSEEISGVKVHTYNNGDLMACFDENVPEDVVKEIAKRKPLRAVFRDSSFSNSPAKINVGEIFKLLAPDTTVKVI